MLDMEFARTTGPFLGAIVATFGFLFVNKQLRLGRDAMEAQARGLIYQLSNNVYKLFVDNPKLRAYFYDKTTLPSVEPQLSEALAAAELLCDYFEHIFFTRKSLDNELWGAWSSYMKNMYSDSAVLKHYLDDREKQYSPSFIADIKQKPIK